MHYKGIICFHNLNFFFISTSPVLLGDGCCWGCRSCAAGRLVDGECPLQENAPDPQKTEANQLLHYYIAFPPLILTEHIRAEGRGRAVGPWAALPSPQPQPRASARPTAGAPPGTAPERRTIFICKGMVYGRLWRPCHVFQGADMQDSCFSCSRTARDGIFIGFFPQNKLFRKFQIKPCSDTAVQNDGTHCMPQALLAPLFKQQILI